VTEFLTDAGAVAGRHLRHLLRLPEKLVGFTVMPVVMVLGLGILFGGSMRVPGGGEYGAFAAAGVMTSMAVSTVALSALGMVDDLQDGMNDRLRSLPVGYPALLCGRIAVDALPVALATAGTLAAARLVGATGLPAGGVLGVLGLELLLATGCSGLGILLGLTLRNAEAVTSVVPVCLMPVTFLSNAFVPPDGLPGWMRTLVGWNPVTLVTSTVRDLLGAPDAAPPGLAGRHAGPLAVAFCLLLVALVVPAAARTWARGKTVR
jgi:ABC-2 type transport system permease protein